MVVVVSVASVMRVETRLGLASFLDESVEVVGWPRGGKEPNKIEGKYLTTRKKGGPVDRFKKAWNTTFELLDTDE